LEAQQVTYSTDYTLKVYFRYEDEDVLENIEFENISERFFSNDHKYVIGTINLQEIIAKRGIIHQQGNFLAEIL
jgi:homoserine dehydrogenase